MTTEQPDSPGEIARRVVRPEVQALTAYAVATAEGMIKLDAMENPFPLPPELRARLGARLAEVAVNRYPDAGGGAVKALLRSQLGLADSEGLILGNGSDELIQIITSAVARPGSVMLSPGPTFVMYRMNATYAGMRYVDVPLGRDFGLDVPAMLEAIARERPALVFVAYPNNPTGTLYPAEAVDKVIRAAPGLVVVDEAYSAFSSDSFLPHVARYPNLLVLRTVSKVGLAGIRLGYAVAARAWTDELEKVRQPYNLNALTQTAALTILPERALLEDQAATLRAERSRLESRLAGLPGFTVHPTQANFVLVRVPDAPRLFEGLKSRGILVKNLHGWHPLLANCLRITVGSPADNDAVIAALGAL